MDESVRRHIDAPECRSSLSMIQILETTTTVAKLEDAEGIATSLLEQRLAACVQINGPITSIYR